MKKQPFGFGAEPSKYDSRNAEFTQSSPIILKDTSGRQYTEEEIDNQHAVGICTAISMTMNAGAALGQKFSADFQYLLQKKYYDGAWYEGSSIFNALRVGKNYGFLLASDFTHVTEDDRNLPYSEYAKKLMSIPDEEIKRLLTLVKYKLTGYASVDCTDPNTVAKAINDSKSGILCRYDVGKEWWTPSWLPSDLEPLRKPKNIISGHAVGMTRFTYVSKFMQLIANSWGKYWCDLGSAKVDFDTYKMTEAWIPYYDFTPEKKEEFSYHFKSKMSLGQSSADIAALQTALKIDGVFPIGQKITGHYGEITRKAVYDFTVKYKVASLPELLLVRGRWVGAKTLEKLNELYN